jgi:hypothetical protein
MKLSTLASVSLSALLGLAIAGCDETVSEKKSVETTPGGTTVEKKEKVTEEADGDRKVEKSVDVDKPDGDDDGAKAKIEVEKKD